MDLPIDAEPIPLEPEKLRPLADWRPEHGVLTIYLHADPSEQAHARPPWLVEIENELAAIEQRLHESGSRGRLQAFRDLRAEAADTIEALSSPAAPGRGRALMLPLSGGPARGLAIQMPLPTGAHLGDGPRLLPLLGALDRSALIGLVAAAKNEVRVLETRLGAVSEVESRSFSSGERDPDEHRGPVAANPARSQHAVSHEEKHERHLDERRTRFFGSVLADIQQRSSAAGWDGVLVAAGPGLAEELAEGLDQLGPDVRLVHSDLEGRPSHQVVDDLGAEIADFAADRIGRALATAMDAAAASGHGVSGLASTLVALNEGRVAHLFLPKDADAPGIELADGRLAEMAGESDGRALGSLFEAMAARALDTDARVSVVGSGGAESVAAATRW